MTNLNIFKRNVLVGYLIAGSVIWIAFNMLNMLPHVF